MTRVIKKRSEQRQYKREGLLIKAAQRCCRKREVPVLPVQHSAEQVPYGDSDPTFRQIRLIPVCTSCVCGLVMSYLPRRGCVVRVWPTCCRYGGVSAVFVQVVCQHQWSSPLSLREPSVDPEDAPVLYSHERVALLRIPESPQITILRLSPWWFKMIRRAPKSPPGWRVQDVKGSTP